MPTRVKRQRGVREGDEADAEPDAVNESATGEVVDRARQVEREVSSADQTMDRASSPLPLRR